MKLGELIEKTIELGASDLHLTVGIEPVVRKDGKLVKISKVKLNPKDTEVYAKELLRDLYGEYIKIGEIDTSISLHKVGRLRVNIYRQRSSDAIAIRIVGLKIPTLTQLKMPEIVSELTKNKKGLVLITGPTGSGKSTTLAAMINEINNNRRGHIITLEDPVEFLHKHNKCIVNQREIGKDTKSYISALRAALRQDPDVILIGEIRDFETMAVAMTAAETGHLVLSTLHTIGADKTIDRIVDLFSKEQQHQIRVQLSSVIKGIISQQLIPKKDGKGRICACEIMISTSAVQNLIREGKTHQLQSLIQTGSKYGMKTMDISIAELYRNADISYENALIYSVNKNILERMINL